MSEQFCAWVLMHHSLAADVLGLLGKKIKDITVEGYCIVHLLVHLYGFSDYQDCWNIFKVRFFFTCVQSITPTLIVVFRSKSLCSFKRQHSFGVSVGFLIEPPASYVTLLYKERYYIPRRNGKHNKCNSDQLSQYLWYSVCSMRSSLRHS